MRGIPSYSYQLPRSFIIGTVLPNKVLAAGLPNATIALGRMACSCLIKNGLQASISFGFGSLLLGGRHFTILQI